MTNLIPQTSRKSAAATAAEQHVLRARAGHASFSRSFADMAGNTVETGSKAVAFITSLGGASNLPEVTAERSAKKADILEGLPSNAKRAVERFDDDTKAFVAMIHKRNKATNEPVDFTACEAGSILKRDEEKARRTVEALVSARILLPSYNSMGGLSGYLPGHTD